MTNAKGLRALDDVLRSAMVIRDEMPVSVFRTFLAVAIWSPSAKQTEPLSIKAIAEKVGLPHSTVSRHIRYLSDLERKGVPGADLVQTADGAQDRRNREVTLTSKGLHLVAQLQSFIGLRLGVSE